MTLTSFDEVFLMTGGRGGGGVNDDEEGLMTLTSFDEGF